MDSTPARSRTAAATESRRRAAQDALSRVRDAIRQARREKAQPSAAAVARRAGVSRSFIYDNPEARAAVAAALAEAGEQRAQLIAEADDQREATWRERAAAPATASYRCRPQPAGARLAPPVHGAFSSRWVMSSRKGVMCMSSSALAACCCSWRSSSARFVWVLLLVWRWLADIQ
jgi:hypothetical protein